MGDRARFRPVLFIPILLVFLAFLGWPPEGFAAHDLSQSCYVCHNIEGGQVWSGSYSFWSGRAIGMSSYSRPITCDICHTDYGDRFKSTAESHHPVEVISGAAMASDYDNGVVIRCRDCHNADAVTLSPNLSPDLAPSNYNDTAGNTATDGYPNHDVSGTANNQVNPGDPPHLLSMLLSAGQRTVTGSSTYNKVPSSNPAADYAFCLSCHDGSANTSRQVNVRQDYIDKGHYFKTTGGGITAGDRIPCSDCHASHNSPTNARLFEPDNATFVGTRPTGLTFANPYAPTNAEYRALCIFCHDDYNVSNTGNGTPTIRGVEPTPRKYGIAGHALSDTQSCRQCHNPHKTPGGGPDCLTCHTPGGAAGTTYDYIDSLFKGVGPDGVARPADSLPLSWSQHGGFTGSTANFVYTSPYDSKATNDCVKCHGVRHNNTYRLIDADNTDSYAFDPAMGMQDNTSAGIVNANAFCLTCHDGNGAAGDVRIGNQVPPNVAANWVTSGHGRPASQTYSVSLNPGAELKCTACHEVHGSNHAKLLPANKAAAGNFALPAAFPEKNFRSGASTLPAREIDFTDYSNPASGLGYGTAGDPGNQRAPAGAQTGLCDACHRFSPRSAGGTDNVTNAAHTHEGITTDGNQDAPSQMNFAKDCLECHDTHGTTNLEMVRTTINGYGLTFTARTGANSFDPAESGSTANVNSVCVVCHQNFSENPSMNVDHNFRTSTVNPDHNEGNNCTTCHPHGNASNPAKFGFPQAACNSCHGSAADTTGMPASGDGATYHVDANNVIGTRGGDNTAHKIHVNYLVNKRGVAAGSTCYVCHVGGGAQEPHPGNPTNQSFKSGTQPSASYVQVSLDNTGAVLNVQIPGRIATYSGTPGQPADGTNGWKTCTNITCHYGESPSWAAVTQALPGTLTVDTPDALPAAGTVANGSTNNVIDRIRLTAAGGSVTVSSIKVQEIGTAVDTSDIAAVRLYRDTNKDGVPDAQLGSGNATYSGADTSYTVSGISLGVASGTSEWVLVVADIASGATNGRTVQTRVADGYVTASFGTVNTITPFTSTVQTIQAPGNLTVTTPDGNPPAGNLLNGSTNNVIDRIALTANTGAVTVSSIKVQEIGTAVDTTDIAAVRLYRDTNKDGVPDTQLGSGNATYSGADTSYTVSGLSFNIPSGTTEWVLVVADVASGATNGRIIQTRVADGYVTASSGTVNTITPFSSNPFTIQVDTLLSVVVTDTPGSSTPVSGTSLGTGQTHQFYATAVYSVSGNVNVTTSAAWTLTQNQSGGSVGPATGLYTAGGSAGSDIVQATYGGQSDTTDVTVTSGPTEGVGYYPQPGGQILEILEGSTNTENITTNVTIRYTTNNAGTTKNQIKIFTWNNSTLVNNNPMSRSGSGPYVFTYTYDISSQANNEYYYFEFQIQDGGGTEKVGGMFAKGNPTGATGHFIKFYTDASYTTEAKIFKGGTTVYGAARFATSDTFKKNEFNTWFNTKNNTSYTDDGYNAGTGERRFHFTLNSQTGTANNTWFFLKIQGNSSGFNAEALIKRDDTAGAAPPRQTGGATGIACDTCHQFGPRDDSLDGNGNPTTGNNRQEYTYAATGDHIQHGAGDPQTWTPPAPGPSDESSLTTPCSRCHGSIAAYTSDHMNGTKDLNSGGIGYTGGTGTWNAGAKTCANVNCHFNNPTPVWGSGTTTCTSCHNNGTNDGNIAHAWPATGKHSLHAGTYGYACTRCHPDNTGGHSSVDGSVTVTFAGNFQPGGTFTKANGTCASTYCHSALPGGNASNVAPDWYGATAAACGSCHGNSGAAGDNTDKAYPRSGSYSGVHGAHVASNVNPDCGACHFDASGTNGTYGDVTKHADGSVEQAFQSTYNYENLTASYAGSGGSCSNVRCHNGVATPNFTAASITCGQCHAIPASASSVAGSHARHANGDTDYSDCAYCHPNATSYTATGGNASHQNLTVEISPSGGTYTDTNGKGGVNYVNGSQNPDVDDGTCSATSCHGAGTPTWGGTLAGGCFDCHTGTEPSAKPIETVGNGPNAVNLTQYDTQGHGNSTTFPGSGTIGPDYDHTYTGTPNNGCYQCHDSASQHAPSKSATDPYRLGTYATNVDGLCDSCHGPGGSATVVDIEQHTKAITGSSKTWPGNYDYKCVDCHDPHGDGNYYMIRSAINNPANSTDTNAGSNQYGTPKDTTLSSITFTSLAGYAANSYAISGGANDGICEVCHNQTSVYRADGTAEATGTHASRTGRCTTCHKHTAGFKGSGDCETCHNSAQGTTRRAITPEFGLSSHHNSSVNSSTVTKLTCVRCHAEGDASGNTTALHNNGASAPYPIDLNVYGTYPTVASTVQITDIGTATLADRQAVNSHCLSCHNETNKSITPFSADGGDTNTPVAKAWDSNSVASKYSNTGTTPFGKFTSSTYNVLPFDKITKAYSPHGNVSANRGGYASTGAWTDRGGAGSLSATGILGTRSGVSNVPCLDCHNSHGSAVTNTWWKGTASTTVTGGLLLDRQSIGQGTYRPAAGTGYNAEVDLCWDCHFGDGTSPTTYSTYGISSKIGYYHENTSSGPARWSSTLTWQSTFSFKTANIMSDHFDTVTEPANRTTIGFSVANMSCGACHDPHGVSSNQANAQYMVPALKGTWVTSPYKEDRPPRIDNPGASTTMFNQNDSGATTWKDKYAGYPAPRANPEFKSTSWANSYNYNVPTASGGGMGLTKYQWTSATGGSYNSNSTRLGWDGYFIDENTFGSSGTGVNVAVNRMTTANSAINSPAIFGGLCLVCHAQANIQNLTSTTQGGASAKVHNTVMGWAGANTNIFNRGLRPTSTWYAVPPTMHGMDHYSWNGNWSNYGNAGPTGTVWWGSGTIYGTKPDSTVSSNTANAHMYAWGPDPVTQGSGGTDGTETAYHQFPCSKCHSPHVARLPRLLKTNCLDNDGTNTLNWGGTTVYRNQAGVILYGNVFRNVACHSTYIGKPGTSANYPPANKGGWNAVTPW